MNENNKEQEQPQPDPVEEVIEEVEDPLDIKMTPKRLKLGIFIRKDSLGDRDNKD